MTGILVTESKARSSSATRGSVSGASVSGASVSGAVVAAAGVAGLPGELSASAPSSEQAVARDAAKNAAIRGAVKRHEREQSCGRDMDMDLEAEEGNASSPRPGFDPDG